MSTLSKIDPGTLGWVKTEIDETLKQARLALESFAENTGDDSQLRFCNTYLHQVHGTLQMVELDGAAMLAREIESAVQAVLDGKTPPEHATIEVLIRGVLTLPDYLARLQAGQPDAPLRVLPLLNELRALHSEAPFTELDLFRPDLDVRPPRRNDVTKLSADDYVAVARTLRPAYQATLLNWLRDSGNVQQLSELATLLTRLQQEASQPLFEQVFWVGGGYLDALASGALPLSNDRKKLLARIEQLLKKIADNADRGALRSSAEALTKAMLYEIGQAQAAGGRAAEIRQAFALSELLPGGDDDFGIPTPEAMHSVADALGKEVARAQDMLSAYFEQGDAATLEPLITLLHRMSGTLEMLEVGVLKALVDELAGLCQQFARGELERSEALSMPMAEALLLLENSMRDIQIVGVEWKKQVEDKIAALMRLRAGEAVAGVELSDTSLSESEFRQLVAAVGGEIRANLGKVEEVLEAFAADTDKTDALESVSSSLNQVQGALQILGQERAAEMAVATNRLIQELHERRVTADNSILDALAVAIGTIAAYVEGLERERPNLETLLTNAHKDMAVALTGKRPESGNPEALLDNIEKHLTAWLADHGERESLAAMQQDLRDVAWLAGSQKNDRIGKICAQMIHLFDMVEGSEVSSEIEDTLRQSYEALASLARGQLKEQALAKSAPRPVKKKTETTADAEASAEPARSAEMRAPAPSMPATQGKPAVKPSPALDIDEDIMQIFIEDAREMIALIEKTLPDWNADPSNRDAMLDLRRAFHTLKGSGRMVGASEIAEFAWSIESMLNKVREGKIQHSEAMFDLLFKAREILPDMVGKLEGGPGTEADIAALSAAANDLGEGRAVSLPEKTPATSAPPAAAPAPAPAAVVEEKPLDAGLPKLDPTLLQIFTNETRGHVASARAELESCLAAGIGHQVPEALARATHTLQGSARAVGLTAMADASGELERLLHAYQTNQRSIDAETNALFSRHLEGVEGLLKSLQRGETYVPQLAREFSDVRRQALALHHQALSDVPAEPVPAPAMAPPPAAPKAPAARPAAAPPPASVAPVAEEMVTERLDPEMLEIFLEEASDLLASIEESLTRWRSSRGDKTAVSELKRQMHTLKGGARMAGAMTLGSLGHHTESLIGEVENGRVTADNELMDLLDEVHDALAAMLERMQNQKPVPTFAQVSAKVMGRLGIQVPTRPVAAPAPGVAATTTPVPAAAVPTEAFETPASHSDGEATAEPFIDQRHDQEEPGEMMAASDRRGQIRVKTSLLNDLVNYAGEVSIARSRMEQQIFGLRENLAELNRNVTRFRDQIRELEIQSETQIIARAQTTASQAGEDFDPLEFDRFSRLQTLTRGLAESLHDLFTIRSNLDNHASQAETVLVQQARTNTELQEGLMRTRMIGFSSQGARLRHIVRQTSREVGKRIDLELIGADVEVDRTVLERMIGPFEHMIRNSIDHGIEPEDVRKRAGKPATGKITIATSHEGGEIVIRLADDGAGLNLAAIRRKAIERGLMKSGTNLSDDELMQFILMAGFSTAGKVTQISGRGVGMDVVHNEVKQLGGSITVDTRAGEGTTFIIRLPLTLSISQALMVRAGEQLFAVPLPAVVNILEVPVEDLNSIRVGRKPLLNFQDQVYPFMHLAARLGISSPPPAGRKVPVLLGRSGGRQVAIQVDGLAGTREVVIKPLSEQLSGIDGLAGATILGDGSVVLILDVPGLWLTEEGIHMAPAADATMPRLSAVPRRAEEINESSFDPDLTAGAEAMTEEVPARASYSTPLAAAATVRTRPVVMVVDDSITVRKVTQRLLQKAGVDVLLAKDGLDAVEQLNDQMPDLMLVDIEMPRMDGYELTTHVRNDLRLREIPIIMITSRAGDKHRDKAFSLGVNLYMTKPYQEDQLLKSIQTLLPAGLLTG